MRIAGRVARHRDKTGHAAAALIFRAHRVAGPLRRDHQHIEIAARFDQIEMDVEAMREHQGRALLEIVFEVIAIDVALQLVRGEQHHHIGPFGGIGDGLHLKPHSFRLLGRGEIRAQGDTDLFDARESLQVQGMRMALASIADDRDFLALDKINIGIEIIIDAHGAGFLLRWWASRPPQMARI